MGKTFIAKRFIFTNSDHTDTTHIKKTFDSFNEALTWISRSHGPIAAGMEYMKITGKGVKTKWNTNQS